LSKEQLELFEAAWPARNREDESAACEDKMTSMTIRDPAQRPKKRHARNVAGVSLWRGI